jgi:MerR family transcriptional regulator/heat shock protein HspR
MKRKKGFYSISAVAKMFSIHQQTIRLYEKEGLISPKRSAGNTRLFSEEDVDQLEKIIHLTHQLGINLAGVEMIIKLQKKMASMQKQMNNLFNKTQEELQTQQETSKTIARSNAKKLMQIKQDATIHDKKIGPKAFDIDNWEVEYEDD